VADYTAKRIDDMEAVYGGGYKRARAELGVESFGMQVIDLPPNFDQYPAHDHSEDGQEEVYMLLGGSGSVVVEGEEVPLEAHAMVRVGPGTKRTLRPGSEGMRVLALGGVPGKAYSPPDVTKLGEPDPMAAA
jgi:mannose-6-phosphate isomerase-like protein (cupin superfamily)